MHDLRKATRAGEAARFAAGAAMSIIAILAAGGPAQTQAQPAAQIAEETQTFRIPSQPLAAALIAVAKQADLLLVAPRELVAGKTAPALDGDYTPAEAFARLLEGSGIAFEITADGRLLLRAESNGAESDQAGSDGALPPIDEVQRAERSQPAAEHEETEQHAEIDDEEPAELEEIVVTGSNIRGAEPVGSKLIVLDQDAIDRTGFSTVQDVIQSLPQNFGGGANPVTTGLQPGVNAANLNTSFGSSVNLRGLGPTSTLTVINGRRVASAGFGQFVDLSQVPLSAVERIEILPDGASAIYGTDAIAGVTNIILRDDFAGTEVRARVGSVTNGRQREYKANLLYGRNWKSGNLLFNYEYQNTDPLFSRERSFAASSDLRPFGGDDFRSLLSNPGNIVTGGQTFAIPRGQDGTALSPEDLLAGIVNLQNGRAGTTLFPEQRRHSAFFSGSQEITPWLKAFVESSYSRREVETSIPAQTLTLAVPSQNPFFVDPIGGLSSVSVQFSFLDDFGPKSETAEVNAYSVTAGLKAVVFSDWLAEANGSYNLRSETSLQSGIPNRPALAAALADPNPQSAFNPFGDGSNTNPETLDRVEGFISAHNEFELWSLELKADGPLFRLPAGDLKLAFGSQYREEMLTSGGVDFEFAVEPETVRRPKQSREVFAIFGELHIPIIASVNSLPLANKLEISASVRLEDYSDFGTTTNPRAGLTWSPASGVNLRGSFGTSFRAPTLIDLDTAGNAILFFPFPDPDSPSGFSNVLILGGNDPDLGPETATTWSAGIDLEPNWAPGLALSATYFDIDFEDRIARAEDLFGILVQEDIFAPLIQRDPPPSLVADILGDSNFRNLAGPIDPSEVDAVVDFLLTNLGATRVRGLDLNGRYGIDTDFGRFDLRLNASLLIDFKEAVTSLAPVFDRIDTLDRPVDWRMRNSLSWSHRGFAATVFVNYVDNYTNDNIDPAEPIRAQVTTDLSISYATGERFSNHGLNGIELQLSVINLTDKNPPFVNNPRGFGFDPENASPQGRFLSFEIAKRW